MRRAAERAQRDELRVPEYVPVRLAALPGLFDVVDRQGASVGQLSSLIGEELLIELTADWLATEHNAPADRLPDKPIRDDAAFTEETGLAKPAVRDLDAWLVCGGRAYAVEAKMRTAASLGQVSSALSPAAAAQARWQALQRTMDAKEWDQDNKVLLPLRPPSGQVPPEVGTPIYAVWWQVSGTMPPTYAGTMRGRAADCSHAELTVFSGSLYVQYLLSRDPEAVLRLRGEAFRTTIALLDALGCLDAV